MTTPTPPPTTTPDGEPPLNWVGWGELPDEEAADSGGDNPLVDVINQFKKGYRTTEFWLSAFAVIVNALVLTGTINPDGQWQGIAGSIASALIAAGYTVTRRQLKTDRLGVINRNIQ